MTPPEILITADRALLKAYKVEAPGGREPMPRLIDTFQIDEARSRFQDEFTDKAGAFPSRGSGGPGTSIAERMSLETETESRSFRKLAGRIAELLRERRPARWGFAAPSEINAAILGGLTPECHRTLACNVPKDLVNLPHEKLLSHFSAA